MDKKYYLIKLNPARPGFAENMSAEEKEIMEKHKDYWRPFLDGGQMMLFGEVLDTDGTYSLGIALVDQEQQVQQMISNDPASKINIYEYHLMKPM